MKNPLLSTAIIVTVIVLFIMTVFQFWVGPSSAHQKAVEINKSLTDFISSEGKITETATTDEVIKAVFAGQPSPEVVVPKDYQSRGLTLSSVYVPQYDAASNSFKVSFSLVRFVTHKPYVVRSSDNS